MLSGTFANEVWRPSCGKLRECTRVGYESAYRCHIQPKKGLTSTWSRSPRTTSRSGPARSTRPAPHARRGPCCGRYSDSPTARGVTDNDVTRREIRPPHLRRHEPHMPDARQARRPLKGSYGHASKKPGYRSPPARDYADASPSALHGPTWIYAPGTVTVKRPMQWAAGHETVTDPKTGQSRRTVALPRSAVKRLTQLRHGRTGHLAADPNANQVTAHHTSWRQRMKTLLHAAKEPQAHLPGTLAIAAGADISMVARQLGHSDIKTTARYHLHPDSSMLRSLQRA